MNCPHCHRAISPTLIARAVATSGKRRGGPEKVMRPCPHCARPFSARALRRHMPRCPKNPRVLKRSPLK